MMLRRIARAGFLACAFAPLGPARGAAAPLPTIDVASFDTTCSPCRDFYQHANGGWIQRTEIPGSYSSYGSFHMINDNNQVTLHEILEAAAHGGASPGTSEGRIGLYYGSCLDSNAAEAAGIKPVQAMLDRVAALKSMSGFSALVADLQMHGVPCVFGFGSSQDFKNSDEVIAAARQGGLSLPDRDFYTRTDSASQHLRAELVAHIGRVFGMLGEPEAASRDAGQKILALETALAEASYPAVKRRDPEANYHRMALDAFQATTPDFQWSAYLKGMGVEHVASLNVAQPEFFVAMNAQVKSVPLEDWKSYLRWKVIRDASPYLTNAFVQENFKFTSLMSGQKELLPRWKRCLQETDGALGDAVGQEFVKRNFSPASKARMLTMVQNLEVALKARIAALPWMSDSTKAQAQVKLAAIRNKIGYPDKWRDYSAMKLAKGPFLTNEYAAARFGRRVDLDKIGKPTDREEWGFSPPTVNAYYNPGQNEVVFPAGILQPPFFSENVDDAALYGGIGSVIGHELTHGFDDSGRKFDARGNLRDWWTAEDGKRFKERADRIIDQFDAYVAIDTLHVNGRLTTGENIADLGGINIAYDAWHAATRGKAQPLIDGLTGEQRFFMSWGQVWRSKQRPEAARTRVRIDPHAPDRTRINGPFSNIPAFARAFGCKPGDAMVRPDSLKVVIW